MFKSPLARAAAVAAFAATFIACGSSTEPKTPPRDNKPATLTSTTTGALTGQAGATLNTLLSVVVKNAAGQGADTALVTFAVASGGGSISNTTVRTDTTGVASTTWTLGGTAGTQTVTASVNGLPAVTFTATATAANATAIAKVTGDNQSATVNTNVATAPSVKITDKFGNPVANILVNFAVVTGGGSATGASVTTDANGVATVGSWKLGPTVGANTLTATSTNIGSVTFTATGTVGAVSRVSITSAAIPTLTIGQTATVTASAFDASNNPVANPGITFSSSNTAVATVNATSGVVTAVGAGTANIIATANGVSASTPVSVIGHAGNTVAATLQMTGRPRRVITAGNTAYVATSTGSSVAAIDLSANTVAWNTVLGGSVVDVAVNSANTVVTAVSTGGNGIPMFYILNPVTHAATDSVILAANPSKMVMNSTGTRAFVQETSFQLEIIDIASKSVVTTTTLPGTMNVMKMAPGDTVFYAGATLGNVFEVSAATGAVKRQFNPSTTVVDLDVSSDGKTLAVADGTPNVVLIRLATGGLTGTVSFGATAADNVNGVAFAPDMSQLWASMGNTINAAPREGNSYNTGLVATRVTVQSASFKMITFTATGAIAVAIDDAGLNIVIFK